MKGWKGDDIAVYERKVSITPIAFWISVWTSNYLQWNLYKFTMMNINRSLTPPHLLSSWWVEIYDVHKGYQWFPHTTSLTVFLVGRKIHPCFLPSFPQSHLSAWYIVGARYSVLLPTTGLNLPPHSPICQILCEAFLRNNSKDPVLEVLKDFPPTPGWTPPIHPPPIRRNE